MKRFLAVGTRQPSAPAAVFVLVAFVAAGLAGCSDPGIATTDGGALVLTGDDDGAAADVLRPYLESHGFKVNLDLDEVLAVSREDSLKYLVAPKVMEKGLDRIVVSSFFSVKDECKETRQLELLVRHLNAELNSGSYALDSDGDLMFQAYITFVDSVAYEEIDAFLEFFDRGMAATLLLNSDLRRCLE